MTSVSIPVRAYKLGSRDNLRSLFGQATADDIRQGEAWYTSAREVCLELSDQTGLPVLRIVRAMAALSPRTEWSYNIKALRIVAAHYVSGLRSPQFPGFTVKGTVKDLRKLAADFPLLGLRIVRDNVIKALWELDGVEVLQGPKVQSFAHNILNPDTSDAVTVDSHYIMAWLGLSASGSYQFPAAWYDVVVQDTREVAAEYGYSPCVFQAILWVIKKRVQSARSTDASVVFAGLE